MKLIDPSQLMVPRVYFTEFDRITYSQIAWIPEEIEELKLNLERKVKLLALIKGMVVVATSHLFESDLAREFLFKNPIVLEKGIIVPALMSKYKTFDEYLDDKLAIGGDNYKYPSGEVDKIRELVSGSVAFAVKWDHLSTSGWFKERIIKDLTIDKSVLRANLQDVSKKSITDTISRIQELEYPSRDQIYRIAKESGSQTLGARLTDYADFIYYLSGARAVNSEGVLPQENLIDFDMADYESRRTRLSDQEIFYRIFLKIVQERTQRIVPLEILDYLSFEEIVQLREGLLHGMFIEKYNALMERTKERIEMPDTEKLIYSMQELAHFEEELYAIIDRDVLKEVNCLRKHDLAHKAGKVLASTASFFSFYGNLETVSQLVVNSFSLLGLDSQIRRTEENVRRYFQLLEIMASRKKMDNYPILIKYLQEITKRYSAKLLF